jgi:uncharacterized membrane protein YedE/YeeE
VSVQKVQKAAPALDRAAADRSKRVIGIAVTVTMAAIVVIYLVLGQYVLAIAAVFGGLLFGFGIVIAGGCETGMMYRAMEGQTHYFFVFAGNIAGATFLAFAWDHLGVHQGLVASGSKINLIDA